jgi:uncharacterized membrane protein
MNEKDLVELWNDKRRQLVSAQLHSVIGLSVITVLAVMGYFASVSATTAVLAVLFIVTVGGLGLVNQFAVIREAKGVVEELKAQKNTGAIANTISSSGSYLTLTAALMSVFSAALLVVIILVAFSL